MNFASALFALKRGHKIKRHHWTGYWRLENGEVMMHTWDGKCINVRDSEDMLYTMENMAYFGLPSARIMELIAAEIIMNGKPIPIMMPYSKAKGRNVSVDPNSVKIGSIHTRNITVNKILAIVTNITAFPTPFFATSAFPSPSLRLRYAAPPLPIIIEIARAIIVIGNTTLVAPLPR